MWGVRLLLNGITGEQEGYVDMVNSLVLFAPFLATVAVVGIVLWAIYWLLIGRDPNLSNERKFPRQLLIFGLVLSGLLVSVFVLPVNESSRNQLLGLIGIVISGVLAFSSTTIISNLMAGLLLSITKPFRVGDFIRIGDHFGRVSKRGLFDTEIQTEKRELIALPNTYCINNPVARVLDSGTIISTKLSLGYEFNHDRVELLLLEAAQTCGLQDPFVHILELGDYAVTYRVSGFLEEAGHLISMGSKLNGCVLDTLHDHGMEIVSPSFMNQRKLAADKRFIPAPTVMVTDEEQKISAEDIAFDKAEQAEELENEKEQLLGEIEELKKSLKDVTVEDQKKIRQDAIDRKRQRLKMIEEAVNQPEERSGKTGSRGSSVGGPVTCQPAGRR